MRKNKCCSCDEMPGRYKHTLIVEKPGPTTEDDGQVDPDDTNWVRVGQIRCRILTKGGSEVHVWKHVQATTDAIIETPLTTISRQIPANPQWRLKFGSRTLNINAARLINETGRVVQIETTEKK